MPGRKGAEAKTPVDKAVAESARIVAMLRKRFNNPTAALLMREGGFASVTSVLPTGIAVLDHHVIGIGGLPYGQVVELFGEESAGKTTLLSAFMAAAQRDGAKVAFADAETKFNPQWGAIHGIDLDTLIQMQPETLEDFHEACHVLVDDKRIKGPLMIALDSVAQISTRRELDEGKDPIPGEHAAIWTRFFRSWKRKLAMRGGILVLVNQVRSKIGVLYGATETTFAGRALRHACILRLKIANGKAIKEGEASVARYMHVSGWKNQLAPPQRDARLRLDYHEGFDDAWATFDHAKTMGCLAKDAAYEPRRVAEARANLGWDAPVEMPDEKEG